MSKRLKIEQRKIQLTVILPVAFMYEFMHEFSNSFAARDAEGAVAKDHFRPVDGYGAVDSDGHVTVSITEEEESHFRNFCGQFGQQRDCPFSD